MGWRYLEEISNKRKAFGAGRVWKPLRPPRTLLNNANGQEGNSNEADTDEQRIDVEHNQLEPNEMWMSLILYTRLWSYHCSGGRSPAYESFIGPLDMDQESHRRHERQIVDPALFMHRRV